MRKIIGILTLSLLLLSCGNKRKQEYSSTFIETPRDESYQQQDSIVVEEVKHHQVLFHQFRVTLMNRVATIICVVSTLHQRTTWRIAV